MHKIPNLLNFIKSSMKMKIKSPVLQMITEKIKKKQSVPVHKGKKLC